MWHWLKFFIFLCVIFLSCPIRYSPHAQNELINPYIPAPPSGKEFGAAFGLNEWVIKRKPSTIYIPSYLQKSLSIFYRVHDKDRAFRGFAGLENIIPFQWDQLLEEMPLIFWIRPNFGGQLELPWVTMRFNVIPLNFWVFGGNRLDIEANENRTSFYQFTCLLHNKAKFNPYIWVGVRNSSSAIGPIVGMEVFDKSKRCFRLEYSYLKPTPYSLILNKEELKDIQGSVHYITLGVFKRLK